MVVTAWIRVVIHPAKRGTSPVCLQLSQFMHQSFPFVIFGHVHTSPDIFESSTFSFQIQKFPWSYVIGFVADLFSALESGLKDIRLHRMRVDGSRVREDLNISGYVWTGSLCQAIPFGTRYLAKQVMFCLIQ